ncbi:MAG: lipase [Clostridia bacterium]|nr:lipase [Clostridia bacterium]
MKTLVSIWVSFVMMFISFVPGFIPPENKAENAVSYPYIFVHGLFGWGSGEGINQSLPYWGATSCRLIENISDEGYECYEASVGPVSSNWDRACELYAQLAGTRVDYGEAHSKQHNHLRYGRTYEEPIVENWGAEDGSGGVNKVNLIGHSFGGNTIRLLAGLLANGAPSELAVTDSSDISPLFVGGKANWVNACVTICTPNNGSTCAYLADELHLRNLLLAMVFTYTGIMGRSAANGYVDFHLEQFGLTNIPGEKTTNEMMVKAIKRVLEQPEDNAAYDLGPEGVMKLNEYTEPSSETYYFSYPFQTTRKSLISDNQVALPSTFAPLMPFANMMGEYKKNRISDYPIDETWLANDGLVNVVSAKYPFDEAHTDYDPANVQKGIWNVMPLSTGDHGNAIGIGVSEESIMKFYNGIIDMIENLE